MTNEELVDQIQHGIKVKESLGQLYIRNIEWLKYQVRPYTIYAEEDDLLQDAYFALQKASETYLPNKGALFLSYAANGVKWACIRACRQYSDINRFPEYLVSLISKYQRYCAEYQLLHGHVEPSQEEVLDALGISETQYKNIQKAIREADCISIYEPVADDLCVGDTIQSDVDFEADIILHDLKENLWDQVQNLPDPKQRDVVQKRYLDNQTFKQIADEEGKSVSAIQQREKQALQRLKKSKTIRDIAMSLGYDCKLAYNYSLGKFRNTGTSTVEFLAIHHIDTLEKLDMVIDEYKMRGGEDMARYKIICNDPKWARSKYDDLEFKAVAYTEDAEKAEKYRSSAMASGNTPLFEVEEVE